MTTKEREEFVKAYEILWKIYKSGELTYHPDNDEEQKMLDILNLMDDKFPEIEL